MSGKGKYVERSEGKRSVEKNSVQFTSQYSSAQLSAVADCTTSCPAPIPKRASKPPHSQVSLDHTADAPPR